MLATILDCGVGNLHSLTRGLVAAGFTVRVDQDVDAALRTECLVLPGVGAFPAAARHLAHSRVALKERLAGGLPCIAICLGMQLLFESSSEGEGDGIGLVAGAVTPLRARRVPHMGWNTLETEDPMFRASRLETAWFAHGYACRPVDPATAIAWSDHDGDRFPSAVRIGRTVGLQFHPEKSSRAGIDLLRAIRLEVSS